MLRPLEVAREREAGMVASVSIFNFDAGTLADFFVVVGLRTLCPDTDEGLKSSREGGGGGDLLQLLFFISYDILVELMRIAVMSPVAGAEGAVIEASAVGAIGEATAVGAAAFPTIFPAILTVFLLLPFGLPTPLAGFELRGLPIALTTGAALDPFESLTLTPALFFGGDVTVEVKV
jgi:hypothetical protein